MSLIVKQTFKSIEKSLKGILYVHFSEYTQNGFSLVIMNLES
jgi:hypothetical protein